MKYFVTALRLALTQRFRSWRGMLVLLLAVLLASALVLLPGKETDAVVQVGLVLPEQGGEALGMLLVERSSQLVSFVPTDEATLDRNILTGRWDCGLVVPEDLETRLAELDTNNLLTLKTGPGSTVYPLVRETAAACLMELLSPHIARDYLQQLGADDTHLEQQLEAQTAKWVQIRLETLSGTVMDPLTLTGSGIRRLFLGLAAVAVLLWGLYLSMDLGRWLYAEPAARLRAVRRDTFLLLPQALSFLGPVLLWGLAILPWLYGGWHTAGAFAALWLCVLGISLVCCRLRPLRQAVPVLIPFLAVGCLIFEPVLIDTASLFPALGRWIGWLPVGLFLRAANGSTPALLGLLAESLSLFAGALLLDRCKR